MLRSHDFAAEFELTEIRAKEAYLRKAFIKTAKVTNLEKGYVSVPFVNQLIDLELQGLASDLVVFKFRQMPIDKVVMIPNSGNVLATTVAERLQKPLVLGRKGRAIPGSWNNPIIVEEETASFTTGEKSSFVFNGLEPGDNVLVVDDVIALGNTSVQIVDTFGRRGIGVSGLAVYFAKLFQSGVETLQNELGVNPFYVIGINSMNEDGTVNLSPPHF